MASRNDLSPADSAFMRYRTLRAEGAFLTSETGDLTESDTRSKLIDPMFRTVLGWREADISREEPAAEGFADYRFGAESALFHVEAKRLKPRFQLRVPSQNRILKLEGPHLLANKDMRPFLQQAAKYSPDLGTDVAIVTNGEQYVVFRTRLSGKAWSNGSAIVFHGLDDIEQNFAEFFNLVARERVRAGSLIEAFESADEITMSLWTPIQRIWNADGELVRNPFWSQIAKAIGPLLTDQPEDPALQEEIIRNCYVRTPLSDQADASIDARLQDGLPSFLVEAGVKDLRPGMGGATAFDFAIEKDIKARTSGTYLLTGGVGSGKTTYLRRFARVVASGFVKRFCIWIHIDFLPLGNVVPSEVDSELRLFAFKRARAILETEYPEYWPRDGDAIRALFKKEIDEASKTKLHGVNVGSPEWTAAVNSIVSDLYNDDERLVQTILNAASRRGARTVLVLDNTDQLGERFQESVFLLSQRMCHDCAALAIVAIREEKFFTAYRRGIFDAYGDRRFHIGSPNLSEVIRRRLEYGLRRHSELTHGASSDALKVEAVIGAFIRSATKNNQNIVRMLSCVSNGDMRHALGVFRDFVSSGNTDIEKILHKIHEYGGYTVPFHEFAKSAILGSRRYYKASVSHIVNVFARSAARSSSHMTACRLLARLVGAQGAASRFGDGFVETPQLLSEYRKSFSVAEDAILRADELLRRGLLESEPPRAQSLTDTDAVRASASGAYYWRYLARSFAYLDLVFVDTPLADQGVAERLAGMAGITEMTTRFERVRLFLDYLAGSENAELLAATAGGPYSHALVPELQKQIEAEIAVIKGKTGAKDLTEDELM